MLKTLLRKQMMEIFRQYFFNAKTNKKRPTGTVVAYMVLFVLLMVVVLGGMFALLSVALCGALVTVHMDWLYFVIMSLLAVFLGAFGSVFNTYSGLYQAKDNDLLLSMPIPVHTIMIARLLSVYLMGLMYSGVVIVPAVIVYWITAPLTVGAVLGCLWLVVLLSLFVMTLSCALGWVVAKISRKLKRKSFVTVLVSLVFFGLYYMVYFQAQTLIEQLLANSAVYAKAIKGSAYPLYLLGRVGTGDGLATLTVSAVVLALFAGMWALLAHSFLKVITASSKEKKAVYRQRATKAKSVSGALLHKELRRFVSSPLYMLNCGLGTLLLPVAGVVLLFQRELLTTMVNELLGGTGGMVAVMCALICALVSMNDLAAPSVSLESHTLWMMQSMPITPWQVLRAKLSLQWLLTVIPAAFCGVCAAVVVPAAPAQRVMIVLVPVLYAVMSALFGMVLGLKHPNLTWTNELAPIKQGMPVMLALLGGWLYAVLVGVGGVLLGKVMPPALALGLFAVATLVLSVVLYRWLKTKGSALFAAL